jgi:hypothetical protein
MFFFIVILNTYLDCEGSAGSVFVVIACPHVLHNQQPENGVMSQFQTPSYISISDIFI